MIKLSEVQEVVCLDNKGVEEELSVGVAYLFKGIDSFAGRVMVDFNNKGKEGHYKPERFGAVTGDLRYINMTEVIKAGG